MENIRNHFITRLLFKIGIMLAVIYAANEFLMGWAQIYIGLPIARFLLQHLSSWNQEFVYTGCQYLVDLGVWIAVIVILLLIKPLRPILKTLTPKLKGNTIKYLLIGLAMGFIMNGICILTAYLHGDISLQFEQCNLVYVVILFLCILVQSAAEEMVYRGVLYQISYKLFQKKWIVLLINPIMFSLLHMTNEGVTPFSLMNLFVDGVMCTAMVYYCDSLWMPMFQHAAWNFMQAVLFGLPNSGLTTPYHVMTLTSSRTSLFYDAEFGVEGTWSMLIIEIAVLVFLVYWGEKHRRQPTDIWSA